MIGLIDKIRTQVARTDNLVSEMERNSRSITYAFSLQVDVANSTAAAVEQVSASISHVSSISLDVNATFAEANNQTDATMQDVLSAASNSERVVGSITLFGDTLINLE